MKALLGIDIDASGTQTVLLDKSGSPLAGKMVKYPMARPHGGWAGQDPADWWNATVDGVKAVLAKSGVLAGDIAGIGISGRMQGLVLLDKDGQVLRSPLVRCAHILRPRDYICYMFTGEFATAAGDADGMRLMYAAQCRWRHEVLDKLGIDEAVLPQMYKSPDIIGTVHAVAATAMGLVPGTPVVGGTGGHHATAVAGALHQSAAFAAVGTPAVV